MIEARVEDGPPSSAGRTARAPLLEPFVSTGKRLFRRVKERQCCEDTASRQRRASKGSLAPREFVHLLVDAGYCSCPAATVFDRSW